MEQDVDWRAFRRSLAAFVRRRVASPDDSEDIVQDVLTRFHRHRDTVAPAKVGAWLYQVARNAIIDHYRAKAARGESTDLPDDLPAIQPDASLESELAGCLRPLLAGLPPKYAEAVRLADLDGYSQQEAAERMGVSLSGAKSRIQRGRALLRGTLENCCRVETDGHGNVVDARRVGPGPKCGIKG